MDPGYGGSFFWGLVAGSSLVVGSLIALRFRLGTSAIGLTLAFGSGVLISTVAFELVQEAFEMSGGGGVAAGLFAGCAVFFAGDLLIDRMGAGSRKRPAAGHETGNPLAIVLGAVLDGVPETMVLGLTLLHSGELGVAYLIAVFLSNLPEGIAATRGLTDSGWKARGVLLLWGVVVLVCAVSSFVGYRLLADASLSTVAFVLAFAGGAVLTMLASEMMPEAYEFGGKLVGVVTTLGFALAFSLHVVQAG